MKKTFILLSIVFMIVMAFASLSFANTIGRNFNEMISDPIITVGPSMDSKYGDEIEVKWNVPRCRSNQSRCVEGYQVMIDNNANVVYHVWNPTNTSTKNYFTFQIRPSNVKGSPCVKNIKHWIHVRAYNSFQQRFSQNWNFRTSPPESVQHSFVAGVDNSSCLPVIHVNGMYAFGIWDHIVSAQLRIVPQGVKGAPKIIHPIPSTQFLKRSVFSSSTIRSFYAKQNKILLDLSFSEGCSFTFDLGIHTLYPQVGSLTCNVDYSLIDDISSCAGFLVKYVGGFNDPMNCINKTNMTYLLSVNGYRFAEGNVQEFLEHWEIQELYYNIVPGDIVSGIIQFEDAVMRGHTIMLPSLTVPNDSAVVEGNESTTDHTYAMCKGNLYVWGNNFHGLLGLGDSSEEIIWSPKNIEHPNGSKWLSISSGRWATVALDCMRKIWTWGERGQFGLLGNGILDVTPVTAPIPIDETTDYKFISMGTEHALAIDLNGTLYGWGHNEYNEVNESPDQTINIPTPVNSWQWESVSAGRNVTLGIRNNGSLYIWGRRSTENAGFAYTIEPQPKLLDSSNDYKKICASDQTFAALTSNGKIFIWGDNGSGELGNGGYIFSFDPAELSLEGLGDVNYWKDVSLSFSDNIGWQHALAIDDKDRLWGWGLNNFGQLGCVEDPEHTIVGGFSYFRPKLINISNSSGFWKSLGLRQGTFTSMAIDSNNELWGWGSAHKGKLATNPPPDGWAICDPVAPIVFGRCD